MAEVLICHCQDKYLLNREKSRCPYLTLSAVPAARNLKLLSWEAANPGVLHAKATICKSRCLFSPTGVKVNLRHPEVRAVVLAVPAVPAPTVVHVINLERPADSQLELLTRKSNRKGFHA
jgi:hypothetical protein